MKPMMSDKEVQIIRELITKLDNFQCLEWGSGGSTVYFPKKHTYLNWLSVEHNGNWVKKISPELPSNASVVWVPENEWYVDCVKHSRTFDFILIDGLQRERCLEIALDIISKDGVILLHDAGRIEYQGFIKKYGGEIISDGEIPVKEGGFAHRGLAVFRGAS